MTSTKQHPPALLGALAGRQPPAPAWFRQALDQAPERQVVPVHGADIETLTWGRPDRPGLLLLHGMLAHAEWWSGIAPFFSEDFHVVAMSWSGMGRSGHRSAYSLETWVDEAIEVAERRGLFGPRSKPSIVAHSFGAFVASRLAERAGDRCAGAVLLDMPLRSPERQALERAKKPAPAPPRSLRAQHEPRPLAAALPRFRLRPSQDCENLFMVDHIARASLRLWPDDEARNDRWVWRFDPKVTDSAHGDPAASLARATCPLAFVWGARSRLVGPEDVAYFRRIVPGALPPTVELPDAGHHLMLDQPLALVAALRGLLSGWPAVAARPACGASTPAQSPMEIA